MGGLHGLGGVAHVLQHFRVGVGVLQRLPLELDCGQRPVDLSQLLLVALFPFQGLQSGWAERRPDVSSGDGRCSAFSFKSLLV